LAAVTSTPFDANSERPPATGDLITDALAFVFLLREIAKARGRRSRGAVAAPARA
jgi:hypothetical protein